MRKIFYTFSYFFYFIFFLLITYISFIFYSSNRFMVNSGLIVISSIILLSLVVASISRWYALGKNRIAFQQSLRIFLFGSFLLYLICLTYLLFFGYGRGVMNDAHTIERYKTFFQMNTNFVPFETIMLYVNDRGRYLNPGIAFVNVVGNIVAFAPFGLFMPLLFKRFRSWLPFTLFAVGAPVLAELIQFATLLGSTDIDDVILNTTGSVLIFGIVKLPTISNIMYKYIR